MDLVLTVLVVPLELCQVLELLLHSRVVVIGRVVRILAGVVSVQILLLIQTQLVNVFLRHETSCI